MSVEALVRRQPQHDKVRVIHARMVEVGRFFFILVHVVVDDGFGARPIAELDDLRRQVEKSLQGIHPRVILDVVFTADSHWATDGSVPSKESAETA